MSIRSSLLFLSALFAVGTAALVMGVVHYRSPAKMSWEKAPPSGGGPSLPPRGSTDHKRATSSVRPGELVLFVRKATDDHYELVPVGYRAQHLTPQEAIEGLLSFQGNRELENPLPEGTRLLGLNVGPDGTAVVNFSREIVDNFQGGAEAEALLIKAVVKTLTHFPEIKRVRILVEGQAIESIGGHISLEETLSP